MAGNQKKPPSKLYLPNPGGKHPAIDPALAGGGPKKPVIDGKTLAGWHNKKPIWNFRSLDHTPAVDWMCIEASDLIKVLRRFGALESMTWKEITNSTGSHFVSVSQFSADGRERLARLACANADALFSLRIDGATRVWGVVCGPDDHVFQVLWFDPLHRVCPSMPR